MSDATLKKMEALNRDVISAEVAGIAARAAFEAACIRGESGVQRVEGQRALDATQAWLDAKAAVWALVRREG